MIGETLNDRYKILSLLGEGGMGEVFLAVDQQTGQQVAVKVLARQLSTKSESLERFRREAETLRQLDHPHIVKFVDAFDYEGQYVVVMEYIPGGSLSDLLHNGPLPIDRSRQIALDLCDALIRAHRLKIIHRDIKPDNVLIAQDGTPKLADFGVARLGEGTRITRTGTQVGTPYYMAPEAWEGKELNEQADIWSLGVMLFEMLTGQVPFGGDTGAVVMNKVLNMTPPDVKRFRAEIPAGLSNIVRRMITRDRNRRYSSMRQVAADLEFGRPSFSMISGLRLAGIGLILLVGITLIGVALNTVLNSTDEPLANTVIAVATTDQISTIEPTPGFTASPPGPSDWRQGKLVFLERNTSNVFYLNVIDFSRGDQPKILLSPEDPRESRYYAPWLSSDGTRLVFDERYTGDIYFMDLIASGEPRLVDECSSASFSPDGKRVICHITGEDFFPIFDAETGIISDRVEHGIFGAILPVWSPDGTEVAFSILEEEGGSSVWKVGIAGENPFPLATEAGENYTSAWSPDGEWIAFQSTLTSERSEVWIVRSDGSQRRQLTSSGGGSNWSRGPCFSPDGQWLAFVSNRNGSDGEDFGDVFVVSLETGETFQITNTGGFVYDFRVTWGK